MYVEDTKPSGGEQLANDLVSGFAEIFGFGDLFKSPLDFTAFKTFKSAMKVGAGFLGQQQQPYGETGGGLAGDATIAGSREEGTGQGGPMDCSPH